MKHHNTVIQVENLYTPGCIRTVSGKYINPLNPDPELIDISDIAHALSMLPRFGGHLPVFYSVAEHSVRGAHLIDPKYARHFLLHDAAEAYLLDLPKPIKERMPEYKQAEIKLLDAIAKKFGIDCIMTDEVKEMDAYMLQWEWDNLMLQPNQPDQNYPGRAKADYLRCFLEF